MSRAISTRSSIGPKFAFQRTGEVVGGRSTTWKPLSSLGGRLDRVSLGSRHIHKPSSDRDPIRTVIDPITIVGQQPETFSGR
jgi:hypothetical protein